MAEKITEKHLSQFKTERRENKVRESGLTEEEKKIVEKIYKEAKMPVVMRDKEFKCGEGELDIRKLSPDNREQMIYRALMLDVAYQRRLCDSITDLTRLLIVLLRKNGVENIAQEIDEAIVALSKEVGKGVN